MVSLFWPPPSKAHTFISKLETMLVNSTMFANFIESSLTRRLRRKTMFSKHRTFSIKRTQINLTNQLTSVSVFKANRCKQKRGRR